MTKSTACAAKHWCGFPGVGLAGRCTLSQGAPCQPAFKFRRLWLVLAICLAAGFFAFDLAMPLGLAAGIPYVFLVLTGLYVPARGYTLLTAGAGTALVIAGYFASEDHGVWWMVLANRGFAIGAIATTAILVLLVHRRASEQASRAAPLQAVMKNLNVATLLTDHAGQIENANDAANKLFGYAPDELKQTPLGDLMRPEDRPEIEPILEAPPSPYGDRTLQSEALFGRHKSGRIFPIAFSLAPFRLDDQRHYVATAQDITYRRIIEGLNRDAIAKAETANAM